MSNVTIVLALLLFVVSALGYTLPAETSPTALIPAGFGVVFLVLGLVAKRGDRARMIAMHVAVLLGVLLVAGTFKGLLGVPAALEGTHERPAAAYAQGVCAVLGILYVLLCVRSFVAARRAGGAA